MFDFWRLANTARTVVVIVFFGDGAGARTVTKRAHQGIDGVLHAVRQFLVGPVKAGPTGAAAARRYFDPIEKATGNRFRVVGLICMPGQALIREAAERFAVLAPHVGEDDDFVVGRELMGLRVDAGVADQASEIEEFTFR